MIFGLLLFLPKAKSVSLYSDPVGVVFLVLAGVCALGIDYFALKAYSSGLEVSVSGPIIIAGSIVVATMIGFMFLGETISIMKILALIMIIVGSIILMSITK